MNILYYCYFIYFILKEEKNMIKFVIKKNLFFKKKIYILK